MDKKYWVGIVSAIIIVPCLTLGWRNLQSIWAAPEKITAVSEKVEKTDKKVEKQSSSLEQISALYLEQKARQDTQEKVSELQIQNLKDLIEVTKDIKKKK